MLADRDSYGFTLHTRSSLTIPGAWGTLVLMYPPAAIAEAMRERFEERMQERFAEGEEKA